MRKLILFLTLMGGSVLFFGVAAPAVSAANCTSPDVGTIWYNGYWGFQEYVQGCTGVNAVTFYGADAGNGTGIYDVTRAQYHYTFTYSVTAYGVHSSYTNNGPQVYVWGQGCGFPTFLVKPFFYWKIRNSVGNTWGDWHGFMAGTAQSIC